MPTEPGWYWLRLPYWRETQCVCVHYPHLLDDELWVLGIERLEEPLAWIAKTYPDAEWGGRIPDSPTLKARRELAEHCPLHLECASRRWYCPHCGAIASRQEDVQHAPDCPWLRAQEKDDA